MECLSSSASAGSKGGVVATRDIKEGERERERGKGGRSRKSGTADKSYPANVARQRELVKPTGVLKSTTVAEGGREREGESLGLVNDSSLRGCGFQRAKFKWPFSTARESSGSLKLCGERVSKYLTVEDGGEGGKQRPIKIHGPFELLSLSLATIFRYWRVNDPERKGYSRGVTRGEERIVTALTHPRNSLSLSFFSSFSPPPFFLPFLLSRCRLSSALPSWKSANSLFLIIVGSRPPCLLRAGEYAMGRLTFATKNLQGCVIEKKIPQRSVNNCIYVSFRIKWEWRGNNDILSSGKRHE